MSYFILSASYSAASKSQNMAFLLHKIARNTDTGKIPKTPQRPRGDFIVRYGKGRAAMRLPYFFSLRYAIGDMPVSRRNKREK